MKNSEVEIWKDVVGYEKLYQVSNLGNVKSLNYNKKKIIQDLKQSVNNKGYLFVFLCNKTKPKRFYAHQLVAISFLNHIPKKGIVVDHIDGNPLNNNLNNLQIITHRENVSKSLKHNHTNTGIRIKNGKYSVHIKIENVDYYLGRYETLELAKLEYKNVLKEYEENKILPKNYVDFYSNIKGISYNKLKNTWIAYAYIDRKRVHIGTYKTELEAIINRNKYFKK